MSDADPQAFLQAMYKEQCDQARQHETMRQQVTSTLLVLAAAITTATASTIAAFLRLTPDVRAIAFLALPGLAIVWIANLGKRLSIKHYERNQLHVERSRQYRRRLTDLFPKTDYSEINKFADEEHKKNHGKKKNLRVIEVIDQNLYQYWVDIFGLLSGAGYFLIVIPILIAVVAWAWPLVALFIRF
ncbi:hypothetical protein [Bradyrhizobium sp. 145]|uniref:hypothetical protein n=1 Tax=Bradyrhizobium sp. 145 TaxID=2782621 RepID=UPI001FF7664F|nr:hypothetical protein [Bradyrhizobium sp. 145]MCK1689581.1 hypothetical protein [Bradyrhizobium sp. 145]